MSKITKSSKGENCTIRVPEFSLFAIPNGSKRNPVTGAILKREGVRKGIVDLMLAVPTKTHHGLFIEMKAGTNKPSKEQKEFLGHALTQGYQAAVCYDWVDASKVIHEYLGDR